MSSFLEQRKKLNLTQEELACFSVSPIHPMLWANYTNNHQGVCIQYNTDLDKDFFEGLNTVDYLKNFETLDYSFEDGFEPFRKLFYQKIKIWEQEYEVRLIKKGKGKYAINQNAIRSIAFGLRTSDEYKKKIINVVKKLQPHIEIYNTTIMEEGFGFSFQSVIKE